MVASVSVLTVCISVSTQTLPMRRSATTGMPTCDR